MRTFAFFLGAMLVAGSAAAQAVYESRDRAGPVFSDKPSQGATEVTLPPLNRMDSPQAPPEPAMQGTRPAPAAVAYTTLRIVQPENDGTIHSNTGEFSVQLAIEPALRTAHGDALAVKLDGTLLPETRTSLPLKISQSDWQMAARDNIEHQIEVAVVDRSGTAIIVSTPVRFYVHRATKG